MSETAIKIDNLKKQYTLGAIGGRTLNAELQSWWANKRGKDDPNQKLGEDTSRYGESFYALDGINLEIKKGEAIGIIGSNGAGKSTLLKILSRVTAPTEGDVWINGRIASMLEVGTGFHGELTGRENIYMNGAILGMTRKEVDEKIESIIDFSECRQFIDTPVKRYSSGMYVKLAFAVASHLDAEIMIMDEVLAVGDMKFQKKCLGKMGEDAASGKTVLYVSHNMSTIRNLCTRCVVLDKGTVVFDGDVEKAIDVYMGANTAVSPATLDNTLWYRGSSPDSLGKRAMIETVVFENKDSLIFNHDEQAEVSVLVSANVELSNMYMGLSISATDLTPISFDYTFIGALKENTKKEYKFKLKFENLPEGDYKIQFNLHRQTQWHSWDESYDESEWLSVRIINGKPRLVWRRDWFGYVELFSIKTI